MLPPPFHPPTTIASGVAFWLCVSPCKGPQFTQSASQGLLPNLTVLLHLNIKLSLG